MAGNHYDTGRLNLPFVGHCTFAKQKAVTDWAEIDADIAVLGAPYDMGTQYRAGARFLYYLSHYEKELSNYPYNVPKFSPLLLLLSTKISLWGSNPTVHPIRDPVGAWYCMCAARLLGFLAPGLGCGRGQTNFLASLLHTERSRAGYA